MPSPVAKIVAVSIFALSGPVSAAMLMMPSPSFAKDGGNSGSGGSSGGGSSGGGSSSGSSSGGSSSGGSSSGSSSSNSGNSNDGSGGQSGTSGDDSPSSATSGSGRREGSAQSGAISGRDQDYAREAVVRGAAVPLAKVIPVVRAHMVGDVLDVQVRRLMSGALVYDVTVLSAGGEYRSIIVDAKRNRIIETGQR